MVKKITAALCGIALTAATANVAFNSPTMWGTVRENSVKASFIADSSLIGSVMKLTLSETVDGTERVVAKKSLTLNELSTEYSFTVKKPVPGGEDFHSLSWEVGEYNGVVEPFAIAPVMNNIDPKAISAVKTSSSVTADNYKTVQGIKTFTVGSSEVSLVWTPSSLFMVVTGGSEVKIALDPANMKGGFRAFSQREVVVNLEKGSAEYNFYEREARTAGIHYQKNSWKGDMKTTVENKVAVVEIPWYEIGSKPFAGRQIGVLVESGDDRFPGNSITNAPATWGNFILK